MGTLAIALVTFASFMPALWADFVDLDDDYNFLSNPHYRGLGSSQLVWMLTTAWSGHWAPLTWLSLSLDWALWGMNPFGYHLTSLMLHAANGAALFVIAARLIARALPGASRASIASGAAVAALVFAIHPLRTESVVWVSSYGVGRDPCTTRRYLSMIFVASAAERETGSDGIAASEPRSCMSHAPSTTTPRPSAIARSTSHAGDSRRGSPGASVLSSA